ncbi:hypothetical protein [Amycolatopsis japonica]|nr:hypothetical protein [Amycolatopsis japonica]
MDPDLDALSELARAFVEKDLLGGLAVHVRDLRTVQAVAIAQMDERGRAGRTLASTELCRVLLETQLTMAEGPCWDSMHSRESLGPVRCGSGYPRWPRFDRYAGEAGVTAVTAIPVRTQNAKAGVLMHARRRNRKLRDLASDIAEGDGPEELNPPR